MASIDLVTIMGNLSRSLFSVQKLITGLGYVLGIFFIIKALQKLREVAESRSRGGHGTLSEPIILLLCGAALLYLPSALTIFSNTLFGSSSSILQYSTYNPYNIYSIINVMVITAGLIWFVRGCVLLTHSNHSGGQKGTKSEGMKGLAFIIAGILAINFKATIAMLNYIMTGLIQWVWH